MRNTAPTDGGSLYKRINPTSIRMAASSYTLLRVSYTWTSTSIPQTRYTIRETRGRVLLRRQISRTAAVVCTGVYQQLTFSVYATPYKIIHSSLLLYILSGLSIMWCLLLYLVDADDRERRPQVNANHSLTPAEPGRSESCAGACGRNRVQSVVQQSVGQGKQTQCSDGGG